MHFLFVVVIWKECKKKGKKRNYLLTLFTAVKCSIKVGVYHSFPALVGHVLHWAAELTSSIIHQKVYSAKLLEHRRHKVLHLHHKETRLEQTYLSAAKTSNFF